MRSIVISHMHSTIHVYQICRNVKAGVVSTTNVLRDLLPRRYLLSLHSVSHHAVHPTARHDIATQQHVKEKMCDTT